MKRLFLVAIRDDHRTAWCEIPAVAQIGPMVARFQRLARGGTVVLFDQAGRAARGVISQALFFPLRHRDLARSPDRRPLRMHCDATRRLTKDIGCGCCSFVRPLSVALVSAWGCLTAPQAVRIMGDHGPVGTLQNRLG